MEGKEYELWQGDMLVASASGPNARQEIRHYAAQYAQDGPVDVYEVTRVKLGTIETVTPDWVVAAFPNDFR